MELLVVHEPCREAGGRPLGEQRGGEQSLAVPTKGAGNVAVLADEYAAEVRIYPRQRPQSLQPGTPSHRSTDLPGTTLRRTGRVAGACQPNVAVKDRNASCGERFALD